MTILLISTNIFLTGGLKIEKETIIVDLSGNIGKITFENLAKAIRDGKFAKRKLSPQDEIILKLNDMTKVRDTDGNNGAALAEIKADDIAKGEQIRDIIRKHYSDKKIKTTIKIVITKIKYY